MARAMAESSSAAPEGEEAEEESGLRNAVDAVPYMLHVLVVFVITWLFLPITFYGFIIFCLFIIHLVQVERRGREIDRRGIAFEERRKLNTRRTFDEAESSRWLNEGIKSMWPVCMEKFASKHFFGPMAPHFLDKYRPTSFVREAKLNIESLHLGKTPPVFNFIRALEKPLDNDHVAYEAEMDFCSSDDMKAEMTVQTYPRWRTTFYISNLRIHGKVRISVKFLKGWPVVRRVRFCFASVPVVTMSYKPFSQSFPDVSLFRDVEKYVDGMVKHALEDSVVQPNILEVNIEALASILSSGLQGARALNGLKVEEKFTLFVEILEARDLKAADKNGLSDPFVNIGFGQQIKKTKVKKRTLTPKWQNEQHQFNIINWNLPNFVTLRVQDWDLVKRRPPTDLGILSVPLNDMYRDGKELNESGKRYEFGKRYVFWKPLEKVNSHEVTGDLRYAITVIHDAHPRAFEELRMSDAELETTATQEITQSSAIDYAAYSSPLRSNSTEMKRSKSDTNLKAHDRTPPKRPKGKSKQGTRSNTPPENSSPLQHTSREALQEQAPIGEIHDPIIMPYGPLGAFRIIHPGSLQAPGSRTKTKASPAQPPPNLRIMDQEDAESPVMPPPGRRTRLRGFLRKRRPSQENLLADSTVSEHSGSLESIDIFTDLKNLDDPANNLIAPEEPPDMFIRGSTSQLEPIISGKVSASLAAAAAGSGAAHSLQVSTPNGSDGLQELAASQFPLAQVDHQGDSAHASGELPVPPAHPTPQGSQAKPKMSSLPKSWWKKIKSLTAKAGRKKTKKAGRDTANGLAYSLKHHLNGDHDGEDWGSESFTLESSPFDGANLHRNNSLGTPGSGADDSPELRKLIQETPQSRAAGSQSDRSWASKWTQRIRDQSKSLRFDSLHVGSKLHSSSPSGLNTIPERPPPARLHQRNGSI